MIFPPISLRLNSHGNYKMSLFRLFHALSLKKKITFSTLIHGSNVLGTMLFLLQKKSCCLTENVSQSYG